MVDFKDLNIELPLFRHSVKNRVDFYEVDSFEVVHNIRYFYWLECARLEYLRNIGYKITSKTIVRDLPLMVVHQEIDYLSSLRFDEEYEILSRVVEVRNSSLTFRNIIRKYDGNFVAISSAILVNISPVDFSPNRIPDDLRLMMKDFESDNIQFIES